VLRVIKDIMVKCNNGWGLYILGVIWVKHYVLEVMHYKGYVLSII
jgi:hypothetical protein